MKIYFCLLFIFLLSFPLAKKSYKFSYKETLSKKVPYFNHLDDKTKIRLFSLLFGEKKELSKKDKNAFSNFGLFHLLTPSGLHYSTLMIFPKMIIPKIPFLIFNLLFFLLLKLSCSFQAISRVVLFNFLSSSKIFKNYKAIFILTFLTDLIITPFETNGLSLLLSFVFWGTIIFYGKRKILCFVLLFLNQIIVSSLMGTPINFLSFIVNPAITFLFVPFYLIIILFSFLSLIFKSTMLLHFLLNLFFSFISYLNETTSPFLINIKFSFFLTLLFCFIFYKKKKILILLLMTLSFQTGDNYQYKKRLMTKTSLIKIPKINEITKRAYKDHSYKLHTNSSYCNFLLEKYYWEIRCFRKKERAQKGPKRLAILHSLKR